MRKDSNKGILLESGTNEVEFLVITLNNQRYGINVSKIRAIQVYEAEKVAPLPHQTSDVIGLMPFRDLTISIVDLSLNLKPAVFSPPEKRLLVVTEFNKRTTGFIVDAVDRIERCNWSQFEPITDTSCNSNSGSVVGTVKVNGSIVIILDLETILAQLDPSMNMENYLDNTENKGFDRTGIEVLHCDDSPLIQKMVGKILDDAGFTSLHQFNNGEELYNYLRKNKSGRARVVLSDIEMPKMDGLTLCKNLRTDNDLNSIPVIFFSSMINEQMEQKCRSVGGNLCFSKPQINLIIRAIEGLVNHAD